MLYIIFQPTAHKKREQRFIYVDYYVTNKGRLTELQYWSFTIHWLIFFACPGSAFLLFSLLLPYFFMKVDKVGKTKNRKKTNKKKTKKDCSEVCEGEREGGRGLVSLVVVCSQTKRCAKQCRTTPPMGKRLRSIYSELYTFRQQGGSEGSWKAISIVKPSCRYML